MRLLLGTFTTVNGNTAVNRITIVDTTTGTLRPRANQRNALVIAKIFYFSFEFSLTIIKLYSNKQRESILNQKKFSKFLIFLLVSLLMNCSYNRIQELDEEVNANMAEILNQYKRRADLIPGLVKL